MVQHDRMAVLNAIFDTGIVPVFYNKDPETTINIVEACAKGGARCVEFTNRGDLAYHVFTAAVQHPAESCGHQGFSGPTGGPQHHQWTLVVQKGQRRRSTCRRRSFQPAGFSSSA